MDELTLLHDALPKVTGPTPDAHIAGRQALLAEMHAPAVAASRRGPLRLLATAAAVVLVTAGVTVAQNVGVHSGPSVLPGTSVANALELGALAATAAETEPWVPPRPDQWVYTHMRLADSSDADRIWEGMDPAITTDHEQWIRVGDGASAYPRNGQWVVDGSNRNPPRERDHGVWDYHTLPTDPAALLAKLREPYPGQPSVPSDEQVFREIGSALADPMPPALRAAMFRLLPTLDGVILRRNVTDQIGRRGMAFEMTHDIHTYRVIVHPQSFRYLGQSLHAARAYRYDDGYPETKQGTTFQSDALIESRIVDRPGERT